MVVNGCEHSLVPIRPPGLAEPVGRSRSRVRIDGRLLGKDGDRRSKRAKENGGLNAAAEQRSSGREFHAAILDADGCLAYGFSCFSIASVTSFESGVTADSKRCTTLPLRSTRNLVKFHLMSPVMPGPVSLVR